MRELNVVEKQWIFSPEALHKTPSAQGGYDLERELQKRKATIMHIRSLARAAGLYDWKDPNHHGGRGVMTVASTLVHRFYMRRSFKDFPEELMAGTILFLASKIEEEPLKLRYIVNSCLERFQNAGSQGWHPPKDGSGPPPSSAYVKWETEILATEEIVLETLCFDMGIEQPWTVLQRSLRGLDDLAPNNAESSRQAEERAQAIEKLSEAVVAELGWAILNEAYLSPLSILHPAPILAFAIFVVVTTLIERIPLSQAIILASELADRFGLDIRFSEEEGSTGSDLQQIRLCLEHFVEYCKAGLIDEALITLIPVEPTEPILPPYQRKYQTGKPASPAKSIAKTPVQAEKPSSPRKASASATTPKQIEIASPVPADVSMSPKITTQNEDSFDETALPEPTSISPARYQ